jgi:membrane associated rhomboid family serine protease
MRQARSEDPYGDPLVIDGCVTCHCLWFDHGELESLPEPAPEPGRSTDQLPEEARRAIAEMEAKRIRREHEEDDEEPPAPWQWVPALLGMPIELGQRPVNRLPLVTWTLAALCALMLLATYGRLDTVVAEWGLIPSQWGRHGGLTLVTSFFLHAGILHLVSNGYFLLVFGDNVEDLLGHGRYLALVAASALAGDLLHSVLGQGGNIPLVGASGGIFGVLAFYAVAFPRARMGLLFYFRLVRLPVWGMLVLYALLQGVGAYLQATGSGGGVSYLAHVGGAGVGVAAGLWLRSRARISDDGEIEEL